MVYLTIKISDKSKNLPKNIIGLYRPENHDEIQFYQEPSFNSKKLKKTLIKNEQYTTIYKVDGISNLIHDTIGISGWAKYKDKTLKNTWIKLSQFYSIWAPYKYYIYSESEYDSGCESGYESVSDL